MEITKIAWDAALAARHGEARHAAISASCVAVCGLGGLGSNIALMLARAGVGRLILCDFDRVELSNIHRQQYKISQLGRLKTDCTAENIRECAPFCVTECHTVRLSRDNLASCIACADVICEAFDDAEEKASLADAVLTEFPDKYYIASSGMAGFGAADELTTRRITPHFYLCGDMKSESCADSGIVATRVALCGALQAHLALRLITDEEN